MTPTLHIEGLGGAGVDAGEVLVSAGPYPDNTLQAAVRIITSFITEHPWSPQAPAERLCQIINLMPSKLEDLAHPLGTGRAHA